METKKCFKCGLEKPITEFYRHSMMADGHLNKCKECAKKDSRENRDKNLEYYREYDRNRFYKNGHRKISEKYSEINPIKAKARHILSNAIRDGKIVRAKSCSLCGRDDCVIEGHHSDYNNPLDVLWVCKSCHWEIHKLLNKMERVINITIEE